MSTETIQRAINDVSLKQICGAIEWQRQECQRYCYYYY
jgi:hypothetical protein